MEYMYNFFLSDCLIPWNSSNELWYPWIPWWKRNSPFSSSLPHYLRWFLSCNVVLGLAHFSLPSISWLAKPDQALCALGSWAKYQTCSEFPNRYFSLGKYWNSAPLRHLIHIFFSLRHLVTWFLWVIKSLYTSIWRIMVPISVLKSFWVKMAVKVEIFPTCFNWKTECINLIHGSDAIWKYPRKLHVFKIS